MDLETEMKDTQDASDQLSGCQGKRDHKLAHMVQAGADSGAKLGHRWNAVEKLETRRCRSPSAC